MDKVKMKAIYFIIFLIQFLIESVESQCQCSGLSGAPSLSIPPNFLGVPEVVNGVSYGVPVVLNGLLILPVDIPVIMQLDILNATCPMGWRVPTLNELSLIVTNSYSVLKTTLNMTDGTSYMSSTKSNPSLNNPNTDGSNSDAWNFKGFTFSSSGAMTIQDINIFFSTTAVKCVFDTNSSIPLNIYQKDFIQNQAYSASIVRTNLAAIAWKVNSNVQTTNTISITFTNIGCNSLEIWAINAANQMIYNCRSIYVTPLFGSDGVTSSLAIKETNLGIKAARMIYLFWNRANAPIAPKPTGGFYVLYTENSSNNTYVAEFSSTLTQVSNNQLGIQAYPMDIAASENGFLIYVKSVTDNNKAWIVAYDSTYKQLGSRIIMNNGDTPISITNQTTFYDNSGNVLSGMNAMFSASSGKVTYGRGRYGLLFSHYNAFGTASVRDDHQGDTFYNVNTQTSNTTYAWSWLTSHSLQQTQIYDGRYYVTASLGDVYPENIKVCLIDMQSFTSAYDAVNKGYFNNPSVCIDIVKGKIPGNGGGGTCGRIGGLVLSGNTYGLVYVRKACTLNAYKGGTTTNSDSEIGLITFQVNSFSFTNMNYYSYGNGDQVIGIRAGKYGGNILITYSTVTTNVGADVQQQYIMGDKTSETQYCLIVDFNGNVVTPATINTGNLSVSPSDEIRYLNDGTPIWSYIDMNNNLFVYSLPTPPKLNNIVTTGTVDSITVSGGSSGSGSSPSGSSTGGSSSSGSSTGGSSFNTTSNTKSSSSYLKKSILILISTIIFFI